MKHIYCISGLGADQRMFQKLSLPGTTFIPVQWPPFSRHDDVTSYARKVSTLITDDNPIIIGLSFGGIIAVEIAKMRPVKQLFLISSAKAVTELPYPKWWMSLLVKFRLIPAALIHRPNPIIIRMFGAHTPEEKQLMTSVLNDTDGRFLKWALRAMFSWRNTTYPAGLIHIHGTADKMIPPENVHPTHWIEGGEHIMIYSRADEISNIITSYPS